MPACTVSTVDTPDGPFTILEDEERRVLSSGWTDSTSRIVERLAPRDRPSRIVPGAAASAEAVEAYYAGDLDGVLTVPVRQHGTALLLEGWAQLRRIPAGVVLSYTELAAAIGRPAAIRVAGSVCARNAPALFVPCHRVRRSDGTLGGFAWGLPVKAALLAREGAAQPAIS
ncbi:methylated-DNA--[protein]-cysteine S-methyltransferase [uncultured Amnibacterium sp.]|uniref:methylated-DNA--[protein]-cysteine S-methyltransferase n=1 Tax=uncultured Amnibacterium sp. TaxID=1631851 RepID=UPI0035CC04D8